MSSTNRGGQRHISDYYVTPVSDIVVFLDALKSIIPDILDEHKSILDPCAGGDLYHEMSYPAALLKKGVRPEQITTVDIREDSDASIKMDYLLYQPDHKFDLIITNPPFDQALEIINKALVDCAPGGYVAMLLRLNFFGSSRRLSFWHSNMPKYAFVHHNRISFTGGTTDSIEYMHAVWEVGYRPKFTELMVI